jgi:hypothetical protein
MTKRRNKNLKSRQFGCGKPYGGLSDAQIQLTSGHESKKSLEVYQHLSLDAVEEAYQEAVQGVGI